MTPHKHAAVIKAWADGADVQYYNGSVWRDVIGHPAWTANEYRIKPEVVEKYANVYDLSIGALSTQDKWFHNKDAPAYAGAIKLTFENGKLIKADVIAD